MAKEFTWSQDSISLNTTLEDSLNLLFCQGSKRAEFLKKHSPAQKSIKGLLSFIKESL